PSFITASRLRPVLPSFPTRRSSDLNALSAFHRLGVTDEIVGRSLAEVVTPLIEASSPVDESLPLVVMGRAAWRTEVEARGVSLSLRAVPVTEYSQRVGAVLLVRDVSELRRRER